MFGSFFFYQIEKQCHRPDNTREMMKRYLRKHLFFDIFSPTATIRALRKVNVQPFLINRFLYQDLCDTDSWHYKEHPDRTGAADGRKGRQLAFSFYDSNSAASLTSTIQVRLVFKHDFIFLFERHFLLPASSISALLTTMLSFSYSKSIKEAV